MALGVGLTPFSLVRLIKLLILKDKTTIHHWRPLSLRIGARGLYRDEEVPLDGRKHDSCSNSGAGGAQWDEKPR